MKNAVVLTEEDRIDFNTYGELFYLKKEEGSHVELYVKGTYVGDMQVWTDADMQDRKYLTINHEVVYLDTITELVNYATYDITYKYANKVEVTHRALFRTEHEFRKRNDVGLGTDEWIERPVGFSVPRRWKKYTFISSGTSYAPDGWDAYPYVSLGRVTKAERVDVVNAKHYENRVPTDRMGYPIK